MTSPVDAIFEIEMAREDSLEVMLGSGYGDLIDLVSENTRASIFDPEKEVLEDAEL